MKAINRDTIIAIALLLFCGVFIWASFQIREMDFGQMGSATWPRAVLTLLTVLVLIYLADSLRGVHAGQEDDEQRGPGLLGWLAYYRNALWCYALFLAFLLTLDYLGMLIGGVMFVFGMLTVLGERSMRAYWQHLVIAVISVGLMWSIFTFGLRVILPQGMIFSTL